LLLKSVILLSGGLDFTVSLAEAMRESKAELCLSMDYGQRAAPREIKAAKEICLYYHIPHQVIELPFLKQITRTALTDREAKIPEPAEESLNDLTIIRGTATEVWVPNRNGLFINLAACFAESLGCNLIVTGFNREEAATFPDNSEDFVHAVNRALNFTLTSRKVKVVSYTQRLDKAEIVYLGQRLGIPWGLLWSCYFGGQAACGRCESCLRYRRACKSANLSL